MPDLLGQAVVTVDERKRRQNALIQQLNDIVSNGVRFVRAHERPANTDNFDDQQNIVMDERTQLVEQHENDLLKFVYRLNLEDRIAEIVLVWL